MAKITLTKPAARRAARVDLTKLHATTDDDITRQQREDGEEPGTIHQDWVPSPRTLRKALHMTQQEIACAIGIPVGTWRNWEQGRVMLDPANLALLRILWNEPEAAMRALRARAA